MGRDPLPTVEGKTRETFESSAEKRRFFLFFLFSNREKKESHGKRRGRTKVFLRQELMT